MNPASGDVCASFFFYMLGPFNRLVHARLQHGGEGYRCYLLKLLIDSFVYSALKFWHRGRSSNPAAMISLYFAGRLGDDTPLSLVIRSFAQVLGALLGTTMIAFLLCGGHGRQRQPPRLAYQSAISLIYLLINLTFMYIQGDQSSCKFMGDWVFKIIETPIREYIDAGEMGVTLNLNPAHKFSETLVNNAIRRQDFSHCWLIFGCLVFLFVGEKLDNIMKLSIGAIILDMVFSFMNEALISITWEHICYWVCPEIVAVIAGVVFKKFILPLLPNAEL